MILFYKLQQQSEMMYEMKHKTFNVFETKN